MLIHFEKVAFFFAYLEFQFLYGYADYALFRKAASGLEFIEPSLALWTGTTESRTHCSLVCSKERQCISLLYNKNSRTCQILNFHHNLDKLGDENKTEYYIMDKASNKRLPQSCSDIAGCAGINTDGEYWLYPPATNGKKVKIYCHNMQSDPKEYVTLKNGNTFIEHDSSNWLSKFQRCSTTYTPPLKKAEFTRVAINVEDMSVNGTDYTFAVRTGNFQLTFGQTADCAAEKSNTNCFRFSHAKINTRGTGMILDPTIVYGRVRGYATGILNFQRSADGAEISFRCAGWCGACGPVEKKVNLVLSTEIVPVSEAQSVICHV